MKLINKILCMILPLSIVSTGFSMTAYATSDTEIKESVLVSSDETLSYIDVNEDSNVNTGDIIYFGTEGLYLWRTPADMNDTSATVKAITVKKVNVSTYLQDENADPYYTNDSISETHINGYANKLNEVYGCEVQGSRATRNEVNGNSGYDWVYEFDWWNRHWHNTWGAFIVAKITTDKTYVEEATGNAYCRPVLEVKVNDVKAAKDAMHKIDITGTNGHVELDIDVNQVTINTVADEGYLLDTLSVTDKDGNSITLNDNKFVMPAKDVDIVAKFRKKEYTVKFNGVDGDNEQTLEHGAVVTLPIAPRKANYIFAGWYCEEECITEYNFDTSVTDVLELYAKWIECPHENGFKWIIDEEATETNTGLKHEECAICGATRSMNTKIPVLKGNDDKINGKENTETSKVEVEMVQKPGDQNNILPLVILMMFSTVVYVGLKKYIREYGCKGEF